MDQEKLVSVVVPVYKTEPYLNRCIESIVKQSYQNLEIILVDDGSPDMCPMVCDVWAQKDKRIKVIHKLNQGLGMARNTGINHATGDYICLFDSDDYISQDTIKLSLEKAVCSDSEIVIFGNYRIGANGEVIKINRPQSLQTVYRGSEIREKLLPDLIDNRHKEAHVTNVCLSAWMCLFSMDLIRRTNWHFVSERDIISEDSYSLLVLFADVDRVAIIDKALYFHCENTNSLTQVYRPDRQEKNIHFYRATLDLVKALGYNEPIKTSVSCLFVNLTIATMKQIVASKCGFREKIRRMDSIISSEHVQQAVSDIRKRKYVLFRNVFLWMMHHKCTFICFLMTLLRQ